MTLCVLRCVGRVPSSVLALPLVRHGHRMRGKPPGEAKSLKQRLEEAKESDPTVDFKVNIGFSQPKRSRAKELSERISHLKQVRNNPDLERTARNGELMIPLEEVRKIWWETSGPFQVKQIAQHYGVYEHLFGDAYFIPRIPLEIMYPQEEEEKFAPVYCGNVVKPSEAKLQPNVNFESDPDSLWTLVLTNPDGHLTEQNSEYVHWFVGNIPGSQVSQGEVVVDYLQPFPPRGFGYQRMIFILYKQTGKMDYSSLKKKIPCLKLSERTFKTLDFYRERQDLLTPAGLAFFQADWDSSLSTFFHDTLNMKEPIFEYDFPPPFIRKQEWFPKRKPFNLYMDKYRDPKKISEEYLLKKMKKIHAFKKPALPIKYPNALRIPPGTPSWLTLEIRKDRMSWGRINDV